MKNGKTKIYVVTEGEYSDYHVLAATLNRETAEAIVKKFNRRYNEVRIEEFEDGLAEEYLRPLWRVTFAPGGAVIETACESESSYSYSSAGTCFKTANGYLRVYVASDTADGAVKTAAEKRAKYIAEREGL